MQIHTHDYGPVSVLALEGRIDGSHAASVESAFLQLTGQGRNLFVFDLSGLQYISSAGLRVVLTAAKKLRALQGRMICSSLNEQVRDIFEMSGFLTILEISDSRDEAIARLSGQS